MRARMLLTVLLAGFAFAEAGAQQAPARRDSTVRRDSVRVRSPLPSKIVDSAYVTRSRTANEEELMRVVREIQQREAALLQSIEANRNNEDARRQLFEQLQALNREAFTVMSVVEGRCMAARPRSRQGYMGVGITSTVRASSGNVEIEHSIIETVEPGSPAERAGLLAGDRLLNVAGRDTRNAWPDVGDLLEPGKRIIVKVERNGEERELPLVVGQREQSRTVTVCPVFERAMQPLRAGAIGRVMVIDTTDANGNRFVYSIPATSAAKVMLTPPSGGVAVATPEAPLPPASVAAGATPVPPAPPVVWSGSTNSTRSFFGGAMFRALDDDWRSVLGVRAGTPGVLVNEVAPGSAAAQAGLRVGDVITHVNNTEATSPFVVSRLMGVSENATAQLTVIRGGQRRTVTMRWDR